MKTGNQSVSANAGNKPQLGFQATLWAARDQNHRIEGHLGQEPADIFHAHVHKNTKADYLLPNWLFNMSGWAGDRLPKDACWEFGVRSPEKARWLGGGA